MISKILDLKKKKNAVILAHNYQLPEVQDIADFAGDSLGLSIEASKTKADIIVFCGVHFMAETAKILNPSRKVLMPDPKAGCPMANMITEAQVSNLRQQHPNTKIVCYINTTAAVKAECDICCTSGNAVEVVRSLGSGEIVFVPDQYLGSWVEEKLGRKMILWHGFCNIHVKILPEHIIEAKKKHPEAKVMCHPECTPGVRALSDIVASTSKMIEYPASIVETRFIASPTPTFIIATEVGILHQLKKKYPDKDFYPAYEGAICPNMKLTSLEKVLWCLDEESGEINVEPDTAKRAAACIKKMLELKTG
ncbi:MAG: quinolinate synthase NadA [Candidatus Margulisiibacteriota bacterium]